MTMPSGTTNPMNNPPPETPNPSGPPGSVAADTVAGVTSSLREMVKDAASGATPTTEGAASCVVRKAEAATAAVGGMAGAAASAVSEGIANTARHLRRDGLPGIAGDLTNLVRRHPIPAMLVGVGVGYLVSRATTRRPLLPGT